MADYPRNTIWALLVLVTMLLFFQGCTATSSGNKSDGIISGFVCIGLGIVLRKIGAISFGNFFSGMGVLVLIAA